MLQVAWQSTTGAKCTEDDLIVEMAFKLDFLSPLIALYR